MLAFARSLKFVTVVAVVLAAAAIAGCGSSSSSNSTSSLTKAQFIKQGEAICEQTNGAQLAVMGQVTNELKGKSVSLPEREKEILAVALPPAQQEVEEIAALGIPGDDEGEAEAIVSNLEQAAEESSSADEYAAVQSAYAGVNKEAAEYGFKACASLP
jgi:hypothetical protein